MARQRERTEERPATYWLNWCPICMEPKAVGAVVGIMIRPDRRWHYWACAECRSRYQTTDRAIEPRCGRG